MVFLKLDSRYADYFPEHLNYFGKPLRLLESKYGNSNSRHLFADELKECWLGAGFIQYQYQMSFYYKYAPDGAKIIVPSYVRDFLYWYTLKLLENGLLIPKEKYSMWMSWDMHIGSCQS